MTSHLLNLDKKRYRIRTHEVNPRLTIYVKNRKSKIVITWLILPTIYMIPMTRSKQLFQTIPRWLWAISLLNFRAIHWVVFEPLQNFWKERKSKWRLNDVMFRTILIPFTSQFSFWLDNVSILLIPYLFFQIIREKNNNNN